MIDVFQPDYVKAVNTIVTDRPMADLQAYFRWHLVHSSALMLPAAFRAADFEFFGRTLRGQESPPLRWRECVSETDLRLGEALGKAFVEETFPPRAKVDTVAMVKEIEAAMAQDLDQAAWMSAEAKHAALLKLRAVVERIGYPETWRDYGALRISKDDALGNYQRSMTFEQARDYQRIGKPLDRGEWLMTPPTVNAYYNTPVNSINFPAGMLQPPFYQAGRDAAVNYGGVGAMIGHELTHGFDDRGRAFDAQGNLRNWWSDADAAAFEERTACFVDQYSAVPRAWRRAHQRTPHPWREHGRQWRASARPHGLPGGPRRDAAGRTRRLHISTAPVPRLRPALVREHAAGSRAPQGCDEPALVEPLSRQRSDVEHA